MVPTNAVWNEKYARLSVCAIVDIPVHCSGPLRLWCVCLTPVAISFPLETSKGPFQASYLYFLLLSALDSSMIANFISCEPGKYPGGAEQMQINLMDYLLRLLCCDSGLCLPLEGHHNALSMHGVASSVLLTWIACCRAQIVHCAFCYQRSATHPIQASFTLTLACISRIPLPTCTRPRVAISTELKE
jgi:hypothetical protein